MKRTYRLDPTTRKLVEVTRDRPAQSGGPFFMPDLDSFYGGGFTSPIDGEHITSRSQLRAHERKHGVRQAGDFKRGELIAQEKARTAPSREPQPGVTFKWI
jgi:hypothetical protein